jgi:hypothetical protein
MLNNSLAVIHNGSMQIVEISMPKDVDPLLIGRVIRFDQTGIASDGSRQLSGLVVFHAGSLLSQLSVPGSMDHDAVDGNQVNDLIFRKQGSLSGRITQCNGASLTLAARDSLYVIPCDSITYVRSPHAFVFTMSGKLSADKSHTRPDAISFQPTLKANPLGTSLVAGSRPDSTDALLDDSNDPPAPPAMMPRNNIWGTPGARPFGNWP